MHHSVLAYLCWALYLDGDLVVSCNNLEKEREKRKEKVIRGKRKGEGILDER